MIPLSRQLRLYAPALVLLIAAATRLLVPSGTLLSVVLLVALAVAVIVNVRETLVLHRQRKERCVRSDGGARVSA